MTIFTADGLDRMAEYADMRTSLRPYCDISAALRQAARQARVLAEFQDGLNKSLDTPSPLSMQGFLRQLLTTHGLAGAQREP